MYSSSLHGIIELYVTELKETKKENEICSAFFNFSLLLNHVVSRRSKISADEIEGLLFHVFKLICHSQDCRSTMTERNYGLQNDVQDDVKAECVNRSFHNLLN